VTAGSYRVGAGDFFLPSDLDADAKTLNAQVEALDSAVESGAGSPSEGVLAAWFSFTARWRPFFRATFGGGAVGDFLAAVNNGNRDQLIQHEQTFESLRAQLAAGGIQAAGADLVKPKEGTPFTAILNTVAVVIGLAIAAVLIWRFAR